MLDPTLIRWLRAKLPDLLRPLLDRLIDERVKKLPPPSVTVMGGGGGVSAHGQLSDLDADDHPQYLTEARANARYTTPVQAANAAPVQSVASRTGQITLNAGDIAGLGNAAGLNVGTAAGTVAAGNHLHTGVYELAGAVAAHSGLADPHTQYHTDTRGDARYLKLTGGTVTGTITAAQLITTGNLVCQNGVLDFGQQTRQQINLWTAAYGIGVQGGTLYLRCGQQYSFHQGGVHSDTAADPGAGGIEFARLRSDGFHLNPANVGSMWFRSYGATGWFSNTYGGGWHMSDATHIRSYGGKSVCIDHNYNGYGNIHLRGDANYISCYDTNDGRKWLFGCDVDGFYVQRANTASESAGDFVWKFRVAADGTLYTPSLAGTGNRAVYSDPSGNLTNTASDRRLKTSITPLSYGLAEVLRLSPVSFRWKNSQLGGQTEIGLIAQDVQAIIPEVIGRNADDLLSLDYPKLIAVLINAIKTLNTRIQTLEARP